MPLPPLFPSLHLLLSIASAPPCSPPHPSPHPLPPGSPHCFKCLFCSHGRSHFRLRFCVGTLGAWVDLEFVWKWALQLGRSWVGCAIMAAATGEANRNIGNGINVRPLPQRNRGDLNAALQAPVAQDLVVDWLSNLPEAKRSVAESVIWPKLK